MFEATRSPSMLAETYDLHGVTVTLHGDPAAIRLLRARLSAFPCAVPATPPTLSFEFRAGDAASAGDWPPLRPARRLYAFAGGEVWYSAAQDEVHITYDKGIRARCDASRGHVMVWVQRPTTGNWWVAAHFFFMLPLMALLARAQRYYVHAAGLCLDGRGLLLAGSSGSGKTTLAYALARAGFGFLGDDALFLRNEPTGLRVLGFPDELDVTPETVTLFPELGHLAALAPREGARKHPLRPEDVNISAIAWECRPGALVFPTIAHRADSVLRPIDAEEALVELSNNIIPTQIASCQATSTPWAGWSGKKTSPDFERLPQLLRGLLA
jgi:hypothetical protein